MNRELKFRAWDIESSEMIYSNPGHFDELFFHFDSNGNLKLYLSQEEDFAQEREAHIMQFTGLIDMNGKEIYEGDILSDGKGDNGIVVYTEPQFCVQVGSEIFSLAEGKVNVSKLEYTKVVGNIYENPAEKE